MTTESAIANRIKSYRDREPRVTAILFDGSEEARAFVVRLVSDRGGVEWNYYGPGEHRLVDLYGIPDDPAVPYKPRVFYRFGVGDLIVRQTHGPWDVGAWSREAFESSFIADDEPEFLLSGGRPFPARPATPPLQATWFDGTDQAKRAVEQLTERLGTIEWDQHPETGSHGFTDKKRVGYTFGVGYYVVLFTTNGGDRCVGTQQDGVPGSREISTWQAEFFKFIEDEGDTP